MESINIIDSWRTAMILIVDAVFVVRILITLIGSAGDEEEPVKKRVINYIKVIVIIHSIDAMIYVVLRYYRY